ncbi:MAG: hypothetical protein WCI49_10490 [Ferruginibacter sp.]
MRRLTLVFFATATLLIAITACTKNKTEAADPSKVTLSNCSKAAVNTSAYICFDSVVSESRCPIGVVCIWAGYVMIKTSFHENGNTHSFRMMIPYIKGLGAANDTAINGYRIVFKDLTPYPDMTKPVPVPAIPTATIEITH